MVQKKHCDVCISFSTSAPRMKRYIYTSTSGGHKVCSNFFYCIKRRMNESEVVGLEVDTDGHT
jgi:hypothetical protein